MIESPAPASASASFFSAALAAAAAASTSARDILIQLALSRTRAPQHQQVASFGEHNRLVARVRSNPSRRVAVSSWRAKYRVGRRRNHDLVKLDGSDWPARRSGPMRRRRCHWDSSMRISMRVFTVLQCRDEAQTSSSCASSARSMMKRNRAEASFPISSLMTRSVTI